MKEKEFDKTQKVKFLDVVEAWKQKSYIRHKNWGFLTALKLEIKKFDRLAK